MAYCFQRNEPIQAAARRLTRDRVKTALSQFRDIENPESLLEIRKEIKKYRALLRLFRHELGQKQFNSEMALLRNITVPLAPARDASASIQILKTLSPQSGPAKKASTVFLQLLQQQVESHITEVLKRKPVREAKQKLAKLAHHASQYTIKSRDWEAIEHGLHWSYSRGRKAMKLSMENPSSEPLHAWRCRVKDLWYHCRLLIPVAPVYFEPLCAELKKLSRTLGENHDLDVLSSRLEILPGRQDRRLLQTLIHKRQQKLQSMAFLLGKQLYGEKPSAFCRCVEELWLAWQTHPVKKRISHKNKTGKK